MCRQHCMIDFVRKTIKKKSMGQTPVRHFPCQILNIYTEKIDVFDYRGGKIDKLKAIFVISFKNVFLKKISGNLLPGGNLL